MEQQDMTSGVRLYKLRQMPLIDDKGPDVLGLVKCAVRDKIGMNEVEELKWLERQKRRHGNAR